MRKYPYQLGIARALPPWVSTFTTQMKMIALCFLPTCQDRVEGVLYTFAMVLARPNDFFLAIFSCLSTLLPLTKLDCALKSCSVVSTS